MRKLSFTIEKSLKPILSYLETLNHVLTGVFSELHIYKMFKWFLQDSHGN